MAGIRILGTVSYVPPKVLTNRGLEKRGLDTSEEWIVSRTGVRERRIAAPEVVTSDLILQVSGQVLDMASLRPRQMDLIIVATITSDTCCPSPGQAECAPGSHLRRYGRLLRLHLRLECGRTISEERDMPIHPGRGRRGDEPHAQLEGPFILRLMGRRRRRGRPDPGRSRASVAFDARSYRWSQRAGPAATGGGSRATPISHESVDRGLHFLALIEANLSFRVAVRGFIDGIREVVESNRIRVEDVAWVIPHQANKRMFESIARTLNISFDRFYLTLHKYGNISSASCAISLDEAVRDGSVKKGDLICLPVFGGGLTWGSALIKW